MHFSALILPLLPVAFALPTSNPDLKVRATDLAPQILTQISALNASVADLTAAVTAFDGSLLGVLPQSLAVIGAESKLDATILKTTFLAKQSSNFTAAESNSIVGALAGLVTPIQGSLNVLVAKYPEFKKTLESPIVLLDLKVLKAHTDDLITALTEKVTPDTAGFLGLGKGILDQSFDDAIAVYEGS